MAVVEKAPAWWPDLDGLTPDARAAILRRLTPPLRLRYTPTKPSPRQYAFVSYTGKEAFYGGAAGGGKSWALLMGALQYVDVPGYHALIIRRTLEELKLPGALIEISHQWLDGTDARWNGNDRRWTFPSGATLGFGYLRGRHDLQRYQSAAYSFIGFDELTAFEEDVYTFMFARCRRGKGAPLGHAPDGLGVHDVPLRVRAASNPGGDGHEWVKTRYIDDRSRLAPFFPSSLADNPHLDVDAYLAMFAAMSDPVTRARMLAGDWDVEVEGTRFRRDWWNIVDAAPAGAIASARHWDLAATEVGPASPDPDYTVGTLIHRYPGARYCIADVVRARLSSAKVEKLMQVTALRDGKGTIVGVEQEPGSAGKALVSHVKRNVLPGYAVHGVLPTGDKFTRAGPLAAAAEPTTDAEGNVIELGRVDVVRGAWLPAWLNETTLFRQDTPGRPYKGHDDQVDSAAGAFDLVHRKGPTRTRRTRRQLPSTMAHNVT